MLITLLSHIESIFVFFLVLYFKTMSLNSLKIMKNSLITKYSDICFNLLLESTTTLLSNIMKYCALAGN